MGFTDNEIIKMLNEFISRNEDVNYAAITIDLLKDILDLINRLQADKEALIAGQETLQKALAEKSAEIERLSDRNHKCLYLSDDETTEYCVDGPCPNYKTEAKIRTEAIKEFAELVDKDIEEKLSDSIKEKNPHLYLIHQVIKDRLKEMEGDAE